MAELNAVETIVSIAGNQVHFTFLRLKQQFNAHHHFEIVVDYEEWGGKWMSDPTKFINYIGQDVNITMKMKRTGETNLFAGIITNVSFSGRHGSQNSIIISGTSPTAKLDGKPAMDSFMDLPLKNIIEESIGNSGNGGSVIVNPKFSSRLDYICQYNESCWQFLNRLSWQFGEWCFYDGQNCYFGMKNGETVTLVYDEEMTYFDLSANLTPQKFKHTHYLKHDDKEIDKEDPSDVPGVRGYLYVSKSRSESIYTSDVSTPLIPDINAKKDLDDLVKAEKSRTVGQMLIMQGKTQTCKVKIGGSVSIEMPPKMEILQSVDTFLVTQITHVVDQEGHYSNSFSAIIDGIENIPMEEPKLPIALSQIATVKDNADPKKWGRVKIETQWQKAKGKTSNWVRVQTPDAGKSDKVASNRGLVTIPEKGDIVMLGFEYGSPDRPFVAGSVFTSQTGVGGGDANKTKSMTTRSGSTVTLDDEKGSITIKDKIGSESVIAFDGEKNISVTAAESITLTSGESSITMKKDGTIDIKGKNITIDGSDNSTMKSGGASFSATSKGGKANMDGVTADIHGSNTATISGNSKTTVTAVGQTVIDGAIVKLN